MIIDKDQLTELLMDKTGLEKEQVEGQLSELINRIQAATEAGKTFEVEGFGTFSMEDEELQFNPEDRLETEINNKYAGMKPIELIGAFKEPDGSEIPEMLDETAEQDGVWAFDDTAEEKEQKEKTDEREEELPTEVEELIEPTSSKEKVQEEFEELINQDEDKPAPQTATESSSETDELDKQPKSQGDPVVDKKDESEEKDPIGRVLVTVVVILIVGITGFLIYDTGILADNSSSNDTPVVTNETVEQAEMGAGDKKEPDQEASETGSEPEESEEVLTPAADVEEEKKSDDEQQETYGLKGDFNSSVNGYTIVVHSLRSQEQAVNRRKNLEDEGFRTLINEANVQGTMYYRVGIGQFATIKAAQDAIDAIPERYKSDHFIKRIQ